MKKKLAPKINISPEKIKEFTRVLECLVESGFDDIYLTEGQTKIWVYMRESGINLTLDINGNWDLE